jgi:signal transduction histidine kinase
MKDLLLFARPPQPKPAPIDVGTIVANTAELLGSDPALKDVHVTVDGTMPRIMADPDLLKIVFVNLLVNGAHAMKGRGTIRVSLASMTDTCRIAFTDEGPGIPSEVRDKIFTPFFTTKSRGSGLGLPSRSWCCTTAAFSSKAPQPSNGRHEMPICVSFCS